MKFIISSGGLNSIYAGVKKSSVLSFTAPYTLNSQNPTGGTERKVFHGIKQHSQIGASDQDPHHSIAPQKPMAFLFD